MGIFANNAKRDLTTLLYSIQKKATDEKIMKSMNIEDRVGPIIDNIVKEAIAQLRIEINYGQKK